MPLPRAVQDFFRKRKLTLAQQDGGAMPQPAKRHRGESIESPEQNPTTTYREPKVVFENDDFKMSIGTATHRQEKKFALRYVDEKYVFL